MKKFLFALLLSTLTASGAMANSQDTLRPGDSRLKLSRIVLGQHQYMVSLGRLKQPSSLNVSIWSRNVSLVDGPKGGNYRITQRWLGSDSTIASTLISENSATDFLPLYHSYQSEKMRFGITFSGNKAKIDDPNTATNLKNFSADLGQPAFNWNLDVELLEMIAFKQGMTIVIPFYEPGSPRITWVTYKVTGTDILDMGNGQKTSCWVVENQKKPKGASFSQKIWLGRKGEGFIKEEAVYGQDFKVKVRLPAYIPQLTRK